MDIIRSKPTIIEKDGNLYYEFVNGLLSEKLDKAEPFKDGFGKATIVSNDAPKKTVYYDYLGHYTFVLPDSRQSIGREFYEYFSMKKRVEDLDYRYFSDDLFYEAVLAVEKERLEDEIDDASNYQCMVAQCTIKIHASNIRSIIEQKRHTALFEKIYDEAHAKKELEKVIAEMFS